MRIHLNERIVRVASLPDYSSVAGLDNLNKIDTNVSYRFYVALFYKDDTMRIPKMEIVDKFDDKMWLRKHGRQKKQRKIYCLIVHLRIDSLIMFFFHLAFKDLLFMYKLILLQQLDFRFLPQFLGKRESSMILLWKSKLNLFYVCKFLLLFEIIS